MNANLETGPRQRAGEQLCRLVRYLKMMRSRAREYRRIGDVSRFPPRIIRDDTHLESIVPIDRIGGDHRRLKLDIRSRHLVCCEQA